MLLEAFPSYSERVFVSNGTDIRFLYEPSAIVFSMKMIFTFFRRKTYILHSQDIRSVSQEYMFPKQKT